MEETLTLVKYDDYDDYNDSHGQVRKRVHKSGGISYFNELGMYHRIDGPAFDNPPVKRWHIDGKLIDCKTQEEFERFLRLKAFW